MDRPLDPKIRQREGAKRLLLALGIVAILAWLVALVPGWVRPSVKRTRIRTARVERGALEATLTATGSVVPEYEHVLSSPVDTRLVRVLKTAGSVVQQGEPIVELDVNESRLTLERLDEQIALKRNEAESERIRLTNNLTDLETKIEIKRLEVESFDLDVERKQKLFDKGVIADDELRAARMDLQRSRLELRQLEETVAHTERASEVQLEKLELERRILEKEHTQAERELELATARSDRDGVLTWVLADEGTAVGRGDVLARIADLRSFRIEARIADMHGQKFEAGAPARVEVGDDVLDGAVARILPEVKNGSITLLVDLVQRSHKALRPNLRVDVHLVTARKETTLRLRRGPYVHVEGSDALFVIRGDEAIRTPVQLGIASFDHHEILAGLVEGDEVIVSDMSDYRHVKEVKIR
ncbi:MAG: efflux RND transporter periplasmic adaptor subunit [Candidatus Latescibacterota bacterium]|nr:MAG: efflux RND transporter periplasmic adaptor subunit [Candidatus Latescibacterota bacterium]